MTRTTPMRVIWARWLKYSQSLAVNNGKGACWENWVSYSRQAEADMSTVIREPFNLRSILTLAMIGFCTSLFLFFVTPRSLSFCQQVRCSDSAGHQAAIHHTLCVWWPSRRPNSTITAFTVAEFHLSLGSEYPRNASTTPYQAVAILRCGSSIPLPRLILCGNLRLSSCFSVLAFHIPRLENLTRHAPLFNYDNEGGHEHSHPEQSVKMQWFVVRRHHRLTSKRNIKFLDTVEWIQHWQHSRPSRCCCCGYSCVR